jgi:hypothetical protein
MIRRRIATAAIMAPSGNHRFGVTGLTAYIDNDCALEHLRTMAV